MIIKICALTQDLYRELSAAFSDVKTVEIVKDRFEDIHGCDAMVSAANSFGLMDGGVDLAITNFFGEQLQHRVQKHIIRQYFGEQPVGTAFIVGTRHSSYPWLVHAPTMRVPLVISGTDHVYLATKAALVAIAHHNENSRSPIRSVVFPAMGTGCGRVSAKSCALQMRAAFDAVTSRPTYVSWDLANLRHFLIDRIARV